MSGRKNNLQSYQALSGADMSDNITSPVTNILYQDNFAIQLVFTGTPTGQFFVQVSSNYRVDNNGKVLNDGDWADLPLTGTPSAAGSGDDIFIDINQCPAPFVRVVYSRSSGSGSLDMFITSKML